MKDKQWRFIHPTHPASTSSADIFSTLKTQITDQSQYWTLVNTSATGSNCIILMPVTASLIDHLYVIIANNITGSEGYRTPDTNALAASRLQVGIAMGSSSFTTANSDNPFPDSQRWWKYWHTGIITAVSQSWFIESPDSICVGFKTTSIVQQYAFLAGAILESITSSSGEQNRDLFGIASSGPVPIPANFWNTTNAFLAHNVTLSQAHSGIFGPVIDGVATSGIINLTKKQTMAPSTVTFHTPLNESIVGCNVLCWDTTLDRLVGQYSGIFMSSNTRHLAKLTGPSGNDLVYYVSSQNAVAQDSAMFAPASGSNVPLGMRF